MLAPAATAARRFNAAENAKPRESGICDVTCIAKFRMPGTSAMTRPEIAFVVEFTGRRTLARDGEGVRRLDGDFR